MSIEKALEAIEKKFGAEVIMRWGDEPIPKVEVIPTGLPSLDDALGVGGLPLGRVVEIYGPESSGKTTLCLHVIAECQKLGKTAGFIDMEHALDPAYAQNLGVDLSKLLVSAPSNGETALQIAETMITSGQVSVVVIDSVAALVPKSELEGEIGDAAVGKQARLMAQAVRMLVPPAATNKTLLIFINQLRDKIGVSWGSPETTPGGKALKYTCSMRLDIRRIGALKDGERNIGNKTRIKVVKNKLAPPHKEVEFDIIYGKGISKAGDLLDQAMEKGIIEKSGAWFKYNGVNIAQGRENTRKALEDQDLFEEIYALIKEGEEQTGD